jgi:hypothetical protein
MALPKLVTPTYELELPSTGKKIKYRPFLVKEEKVLLLAMESEDEQQVTNAVLDMLNNCIITRGVKVKELATFDIEYLFLRIRAASIGEQIELIVTCQDDNETQVTVAVDINKVEVIKPEGHTNKIMLDDKTGVIMKYPSMEQFVNNIFMGKDMNPDEAMKVVAEGIDQIFDDEDVYDSSTTTPKEFLQFVEGLTSKQFEALEKFYETSPKLSHTFTVKNPNTGIESTFTIEGLQSFFG